MSYVAYGVMAVATAFSAYTSIQQGKQSAAWNEYNAKLAERNAQMATMESEAAAERKRRETKSLVARQRALYGKAGVTAEGVNSTRSLLSTGD